MTAVPNLQLGRELIPRLPVRKIPHYRGSINTPSEYWSDKLDLRLECESWLEARWLQLLDFDHHVAEMMTQPMEVQGLDQYGPLRHIPDIFVRLHDGGCRLLDVRSPPFHHDPETLRRANLSLVCCDTLGWEYYLVGEPPEPVAHNVAWLAGYRRLAGGHHLRAQILDRAATPISLQNLWDAIDSPMLARTVTFHLLWRHDLGVDVSAPICERSLVWGQT